jgi:hypothetical protein
MSTRRAPLRQVEPPPAADDQVRVVFAAEDDPAVLDKLDELLLQLLRDPKAK